jgi:hypothetical protein
MLWRPVYTPRTPVHTRNLPKNLRTARTPRFQECLKIGSVRGLPQLGEKRAKFPSFVFEPVQGRAPIVIEGGVAEIARRRLIEPAVRMSPAMLSRTGTACPEDSTEETAAQQERARQRRDRDKEQNPEQNGADNEHHYGRHEKRHQKQRQQREKKQVHLSPPIAQ